MECPKIILDVVNADNSKINDEIFTFYPGSNEFKVESSDASSLNTYLLTVKAKYEGDIYEKEASLNFEVDVVDSCEEATLEIDKKILGQQAFDYEIGSVPIIWKMDIKSV